MRVIVMKVSLKADWAHSLKEKRMVVKSIIAKLQNKGFYFIFFRIF